MPNLFKDIHLGNHSFYTHLYRYRYFVLFLAIFIVYFFNMFIDIMNIDAAQYALISMEMSITKSFLHVYQLGHDYLDKPPLLFWLSSLSFLGFGISNFTYKLPSVLAALLGIYSVYRFSRIFYSKEKSILAALILATTQALFLITNDVRTDTLLLGFTIFSIWQLIEYLRKKRIINLILGSVAVGMAMLAKGPIGIVVPAVALGSHFLLKKQWKNIFKPQWLLLLVIVLIVLLPMCYGLYTQFDLHPEKTVYGLHGPSGLRFFFWTQSFGRITGASQWDNHTGFFYFFNTISWDFQPWLLFFIPAIVCRFLQLIKRKSIKNDKAEYVTLGGFTLMFIALSLSRYKLPHYIYVLFPFAAVITADFIYNLKNRALTILSGVQFGLMHFFWLMMAIDFIFVFPPKNLILPIILTILFIITWIVYKKLQSKTERIIIPTILTAVAFNLLMAVNFYPHLLTYQAGSQIGQMVANKHIPANRFYDCGSSDFALDFYARRNTPQIAVKDIQKLPPESRVAMNQNEYVAFKKTGVPYKLLKVFPSFRVTRLNPTFLYKKTRSKTLEKVYLIETQ